MEEGATPWVLDPRRRGIDKRANVPTLWRMPLRAPQDRRLEQLEAEVTKLRRENAALRRKNARLQAKLDAFVEKYGALERRDSTNSHSPPSQDPPGTSRPPKKERSGRKRGGQPGHRGAFRALVPPEQVDEIQNLHPTHCTNCEHPLRGEDAEPEVRQVAEIPPIKPTITEYHLHTLACRKCGHTTKASLPDGVPAGCFGPRLMALVAMATCMLRLSKRQVVQLLAEWFGLTVSAASICAMERTASSAVAPAFDEAREYVKRQPIAHADETGWREKNTRAWLWIVVTSMVTVFLVARARSQAVAKALLGEQFPGMCVADRYSSYYWVDVERRQACWAHLLRDFQKMALGPPAAASIGESLLKLGRALFHHWHRFKRGKTRRATFERHALHIRTSVSFWLRRGTWCGHSPTAGTCKSLLKHEPALWHFVKTPGVEPTNNIAERGLRPAVIWRKICFGTDSEGGSRFVERMLTVRATLAQQGRNFLEYLTLALRSFLQGKTPPSLLPAVAAAA